MLGMCAFSELLNLFYNLNYFSIQIANNVVQSLFCWMALITGQNLERKFPLRPAVSSRDFFVFNRSHIWLLISYWKSDSTTKTIAVCCYQVQSPRFCLPNLDLKAQNQGSCFRWNMSILFWNVQGLWRNETELGCQIKEMNSEVLTHCGRRMNCCFKELMNQRVFWPHSSCKEKLKNKCSFWIANNMLIFQCKDG